MMRANFISSYVKRQKKKRPAFSLAPAQDLIVSGTGIQKENTMF